MIKTNIFSRVAKKDYVRSVLNDRADLSAFNNDAKIRKNDC